jgi:hypothetical protein
MRRPRFTGAFKKDRTRAGRLGKDLDKMEVTFGSGRRKIAVDRCG